MNFSAELDEVAISSVVTFVDTSILCNILRVPNKCSDHEAVLSEAQARQARGELFIIPVTAVVETGNHIAQVRTGDRRAAAERFVGLIDAVRAETRPWVLHEVEWDSSFLVALCNGSTTGQSFIDLAGNGQLGGGDVAILVERDRYRQRTAYRTVQLWSLDAGLQAYS
jgi:hypothetical protein